MTPMRLLRDGARLLVPRFTRVKEDRNQFLRHGAMRFPLGEEPGAGAWDRPFGVVVRQGGRCRILRSV